MLVSTSLTGCSDGGGSEIKAWLKKQDGVGKVTTGCSTYMETGCNASVTATLSPETSPRAACSLIDRAEAELPHLEGIDSQTIGLNLLWAYRGTMVKTLDEIDVPDNIDPPRGHHTTSYGD